MEGYPDQGGGVSEHLPEAGTEPETCVRDLMSEKVVTISVDDSLFTVEEIMTLGGVRHIPVVRAGQLVGVVSQRDLLRASLSNLTHYGTGQRRAFLEAVEIRRVMSEPPVTISPDATVGEAAAQMAIRKIGCLPVIEASALVGMVTETDLLRYFARGAVSRTGENP